VRTDHKASPLPLLHPSYAEATQRYAMYAMFALYAMFATFATPSGHTGCDSYETRHLHKEMAAGRFCYYMQWVINAKESVPKRRLLSGYPFAYEDGTDTVFRNVG
jgi:hypothetical protein